MKKMKRFLSAAFALSLIASLAACGDGSAKPTPDAATSAVPSAAASTSTTSGTPTYTLRLSHCMAPNSGYQAFSEKFKEIVEAESNGDIQVDIYPSAQLGGERESCEAAQLGTVDLVYTAAAPLANFTSSNIEYFNLPFLFEDKNHARTYFDSEDGKAKLDSLAESGLVGLTWAEVDFFDFFTSVPVEVPADLKGLNIRCMENNTYMTFLSTIGANPVPMAASEVPTALSNGTLDGCSLGVPGSYNFGIYDNMYFCYGDVIWGACAFVMSKTAYENLPAEYQELMFSAAEEAKEYQREFDDVTYWEERLEGEMVDAGTTIMPIDKQAFIEASVKPVYDALIANGSIDPKDIETVNSYRTTDPLYVP